MIGKARVAGDRPRAGTELGSGSDEDLTHIVPQKKKEEMAGVGGNRTIQVPKANKWFSMSWGKTCVGYTEEILRPVPKMQVSVL